MGYVQTERDLIFDLNFDVVNYSADFDIPPPTPPPLPPVKSTNFDEVPMEVRKELIKKVFRSERKLLRELDLFD